MKVAIVCGSLRYGGAEHFACTLVNAMVSAEKYEVFLLTQTPKQNEYYLCNKVKRVCLLGERENLSAMWKNSKVIHRFCVSNQVDVVIGIGIFSNLCVCLAQGRFLTKVVISERNAPRYDHLSWKSRLLRKLLYWRADGYVFQTQEASEYYSRSIQKRGVIIHNPVAERLPHRKNVQAGKLVAVGRLEKQKNYEIMIQAFAIVHRSYPNTTLHIWGQGSKKIGEYYEAGSGTLCGGKGE